jgi:hypothetical protein
VNFRDRLLVEIARGCRFRHLVRLGRHIELHFVSGDARHSFRQLREVELHERERLRLVVAEDGGVDLAAFDVLLEQNRRVEFIVNPGNLLEQLLQ